MNFPISLNKIIIFLLILSAFLGLACSPSRNDVNQPPEKQTETQTEIPAQNPSGEAIENCLIRAYPEFLQTAENNLIVWRDSTVMTFDDRIGQSDFETLLNNADLKDQLAQCYPKTDDYLQKLVVNYDPGRARNELFFFKMYGNSATEVEQKLVSIVWMPKNINKTIRITSVNGIDKKFQAVSAELDNLAPQFMQYLQNPAGTFNWRVIAGTNRQSTHSFGTTIDINVALSDYWRNDSPDTNGVYPYKNRIPLEIVRIFEKHGFIWGGKWYHYDTMHFEYRPELLDADCICKN